MRALVVFGALGLATGCSTLDFGKFAPSGDAAMDGGADSALQDAGDAGGGGDAQIGDGSTDADADAGPAETCNDVDDDGDGLIDETTLEDTLCTNPDEACHDGSCMDAPAEVSSGFVHTCVRMTSGTVRCFGDNGSFMAGGTEAFNQEPHTINVDGIGPLRATSIAISYLHSCALERGTSRPMCWGSDADGRFAGGLSVTSPTPTAVAAQTTVPADVRADFIAAGTDFSIFAVGSTFFAAGKNDDGQLGDRTLPDASAGVVEIPNALPDDVVEISAGGEHACALALGGAVHCWGLGDSGQTGPGASVDRPRALDGVYRTVDCGIDHTCAIDETNVVHCWGLNDRLQCGHEGASTGAPMAVPLPTAAATPQRVSAGFGHTCVLDAEGAVYCWGANEAAQLGTLGGPSTANPTLITMPSAQEVVISLSAGGVHTCAITSRRNVVCWGDNTSYQSSRDSMAAPIVPVVHSSF